MNTEANRFKNKTGFGIPKYFKMKDIWNSDKIKKFASELGKVYKQKNWSHFMHRCQCNDLITFVWQHKIYLLITGIINENNDMFDLEIDGFQFLLSNRYQASFNYNYDWIYYVMPFFSIIYVLI